MVMVITVWVLVIGHHKRPKEQNKLPTKKRGKRSNEFVSLTFYKTVETRVTKNDFVWLVVPNRATRHATYFLICFHHGA